MKWHLFDTNDHRQVVDLCDRGYKADVYARLNSQATGRSALHAHQYGEYIVFTIFPTFFYQNQMYQSFLFPSDILNQDKKYPSSPIFDRFEEAGNTSVNVYLQSRITSKPNQVNLIFDYSLSTLLDADGAHGVSCG